MITALLAAFLFASDGPPLPWEPMLTPALMTGVTTNADTNPPAAPLQLRATPAKAVLLRWGYPDDATNVAFLVYRSTNLLSWAVFTNYNSSVRAAVLPTPDARGYYILGASNEAGVLFAPRKP